MFEGLARRSDKGPKYVFPASLMGEGPCKYQPEPLAGETCGGSVSKPGSGTRRGPDSYLCCWDAAAQVSSVG